MINLEDGKVAGIHFGGFFDKENYAEPASTIRSIISDMSRETGSRVKLARNNSGEAKMSGNSITVTVPVTITVEVGERSGGSQLSVPAANAAMMPSGLEGAALEETVKAARQAYKNYAGVVNIRGGWKFRDRWITDERAIIIAVEEKKALDELGATGIAPLPDHIGDFPVDVVPASPFDIFDELKDDFVTEASMRKGTYQRDIAEFPLNSVEGKMKGVIHVGPDSGSQMLTEFLDKTEESLTVGMYEFTAPHIVKSVKDAVGVGGKMDMVLQKGEHIGSGSKADDQPDEEAVAELDELMGDRFSNQWAAIGANSVFPWAYHIKVAVRDKQATWLSSGSWQSSNQPPFDRRSPQDADSKPFLLDDYNREWHVVLDNEQISGQFEEHILQDAKDSKTALESLSLDPVLWIDSMSVELMAAEAPKVRRYFKPYVFDRAVRVHPILTPDNYPDQVLKLIRSAEKSILFQNQSFNIAKNRDDRFNELLDAMKKKAGLTG